MICPKDAQCHFDRPAPCGKHFGHYTSSTKSLPKSMEIRSILQITADPFKVSQKRPKGGQMAPNMIPNGSPKRHKIQRKSDWLHLGRRPPPKAATGLPGCSQMAPIMYRKAPKCLQKLFKIDPPLLFWKEEEQKRTRVEESPSISVDLW